jgi:hypothetical protein
MNRFVLIAISLFSLILGTGCKNYKETHSEKEWVSLFNGKDLDGWLVKINGYELNDNAFNTFQVDQGVMRVSYAAYDTFSNQYGHIFYKSPFKNYRLRLQYRFIGKQVNGGQDWATKNSGVMIHSQAPETMGLNQAFPVSLEVQFLGGLVEGQERPTGNLCTPGTHVEMNGELITDHCINAAAETIYDDAWVDVEVIVDGTTIVHKINGNEVITYTNPVIGGEYNVFTEKEGEKITQGYISLQSESHPIEFKNIEILELNN